MRTSETGIAFVRLWEGYRSKAYRCSAGVWTIGYGHTQGVQKGDTVDKDTADIMLRKDILHFEPWLEHLIKVPLNQNQWDALVSFTFNVGTHNLERSTLLRKLNAKDYTSASLEFPKWCKAKVNGKLTVLQGLLRRRKAEQKLFREPDGTLALPDRNLRKASRLYHPR